MLQRLVTMNDFDTNDKVKTLPIAVTKRIKDTLEILDDNYGEDRDIDDMGGYVIVLSTIEARKKVQREDKIDFTKDVFEYVDTIELNHSYDWVEATLLKSSDYGVVIYMPHTLMTKHVMKYMKGANDGK